MKPIEVKITRAEKRGRKIIITIESDLYSNEVFAVTPFYDEGEKKNQLQSVHFNLEVHEEDNKVDAKVFFSNPLSHFTKGHQQLHKPINKFYLSKKDCAKDWFISEKQEYYTDQRISQILKIWETDKPFHDELQAISIQRKRQFQIDNLNKAKKEYQMALENLESCIAAL